MGSCVRSPDFSPPFHGTHRPKGVGTGRGTGTLCKVSSTSLGLGFAIYQMSGLNSVTCALGYVGGNEEANPGRELGPAQVPQRGPLSP